jgi:hypothetical protein
MSDDELLPLKIIAGIMLAVLALIYVCSRSRFDLVTGLVTFGVVAR